MKRVHPASGSFLARGSDFTLERPQPTQIQSKRRLNATQNVIPLEGSYAGLHYLNSIHPEEIVYELVGQIRDRDSAPKVQSVTTGRGIRSYRDIIVCGFATYPNLSVNNSDYFPRLAAYKERKDFEEQPLEALAVNTGEFVPGQIYITNRSFKVGDKVWWNWRRETAANERNVIYLDNKFVPSHNCAAHRECLDHCADEYYHRFFGVVVETYSQTGGGAMIRFCPITGKIPLAIGISLPAFKWVENAIWDLFLCDPNWVPVFNNGARVKGGGDPFGPRTQIAVGGMWFRGYPEDGGFLASLDTSMAAQAGAGGGRRFPPGTVHAALLFANNATGVGAYPVFVAVMRSLLGSNSGKYTLPTPTTVPLVPGPAPTVAGAVVPPPAPVQTTLPPTAGPAPTPSPTMQAFGNGLRAYLNNVNQNAGPAAVASLFAASYQATISGYIGGSTLAGYIGAGGAAAASATAAAGTAMAPIAIGVGVAAVAGLATAGIYNALGITTPPANPALPVPPTAAQGAAAAIAATGPVPAGAPVIVPAANVIAAAGNNLDDNLSRLTLLSEIDRQRIWLSLLERFDESFENIRELHQRCPFVKFHGDINDPENGMYEIIFNLGPAEVGGNLGPNGTGWSQSGTVFPNGGNNPRMFRGLDNANYVLNCAGNGAVHDKVITGGDFLKTISKFVGNVLFKHPRITKLRVEFNVYQGPGGGALADSARIKTLFHQVDERVYRMNCPYIRSCFDEFNPANNTFTFCLLFDTQI